MACSILPVTPLFSEDCASAGGSGQAVCRRGSCPSPVVDERAFLRRNWRTFKARVSEVPCPGAASSQQVALGGFTAAEAAHRLAECGYNELPENGCGDLLDSRLYSQTQSYLLILL